MVYHSILYLLCIYMCDDNKSLAHKEILACLHTRGGIFCWGPILYLVRRSSSACSIKQCENLLLIPKTWETDNNTHLQDHSCTSLPPKGKKKRKKKAGSIGCILQFPIGSSRIFIPNHVHHLYGED